MAPIQPGLLRKILFRSRTEVETAPVHSQLAGKEANDRTTGTSHECDNALLRDFRCEEPAGFLSPVLVTRRSSSGLKVKFVEKGRECLFAT